MISRHQKYYPVPLPAHNLISPEKAQSEADDFFKRMSKRHSIRDFSNTDIDENVIRTAIRTAARAPSGANQQPWHFVAIKDAEMKQKIRAYTYYGRGITQGREELAGITLRFLNNINLS